MQWRKAFRLGIVTLAVVLVFFFLPVFPIGGSGAYVYTPGNGCDPLVSIDCPPRLHVEVSGRWSAVASPGYHLFTCGEWYFSSRTIKANVSYSYGPMLGNYTQLTGWYCGRYNGTH